MKLSQKQKTFSRSFSAVLKSRLNFEHFETKMTFIANVFPKLRTTEDAVNTFTANDKYSLLYRDNLTQPRLLQLSQKQKFVSQFFSAVLKSRLNLEHFQKKDDPHT